MAKNQFISSIMMASIAEGVSIRETAMHTYERIFEEAILAQSDSNLFAQIGGEQQGNTVPYYGPENHSPDTTAIYTPFLPQSDTTTYTDEVNDGNEVNDEGEGDEEKECDGEYAQTQSSTEATYFSADGYSKATPFYEQFAQTESADEVTR